MMQKVRSRKKILLIAAAAALLLCASFAVLHFSAEPPSPSVLILDDRDLEKAALPRELTRAGCQVTVAFGPDAADPHRYDALVIPGGGDVDPSLWGDSPHPAAGPFTPDKDRIQIRAIRRFAKAGKPVLGICRGAQLINVAFGGSMIQNLHQKKTSPTYEEGFYRVENVEGSWVHRIYGSSPEVYFRHHQAVDRLGDGIVASSWSTEHPHRHVEAIEHESLPLYGVQWHPDAYVRQQGTALFTAFRDLCLQNMAE